MLDFNIVWITFPSYLILLMRTINWHRLYNQFCNGDNTQLKYFLFKIIKNYIFIEDNDFFKYFLSKFYSKSPQDKKKKGKEARKWENSGTAKDMESLDFSNANGVSNGEISDADILKSLTQDDLVSICKSLMITMSMLMT